MSKPEESAQDDEARDDEKGPASAEDETPAAASAEDEKPAAKSAEDEKPAAKSAKGDKPAAKSAKGDKSAAKSAGPPAKAPHGSSKDAAAWGLTGAMRALPAYGLATLSGLLYFVAFPGVDVWPAAFVALVPLLVALRGQPTRRATGLGWMAGFTMTMTGFYWLLDMLKVFSGFPTAACVFFMAVLCAFQAGRIGLCGWLYGRAAKRGWPAPGVFALAFAASELVYPLLFPWYFGATVHSAPVMMQVSDLGGPILVGLVLVAANLGIAELILARREGRAVDRRLVAVGVAVPALAAVYGFVRMRSVDAAAAAAKPVKIGIVQGNMPLFDRKASIAVHTKRTRELRDKGAELVVWSEAAVTRAFIEDTHKDDVRNILTKGLGVPTIVGTVLRRPATRGDEESRVQYFNTALFAGDGGVIQGRYDKQFLLAFGEYLPLGSTFPILYKWSPNSGRFTPGTSIEPLPWGEHKISALICYEDILPSFVNGVVRHADPDLLVNLTNDAWFGDSTEPWIHLALSKLRAVEHRRYLVRATNSGVSAIVDPVGRVVVHSGTFKEESLLGEARFMRSTTLYEIIGDIPWWIATLAVIAMGIFSRPRPGQPDGPKPKADKPRA